MADLEEQLSDEEKTLMLDIWDFGSREDGNLANFFK
uniref:Capping actin protein of muscle Z-line subunit alpha 2 n=1 Tax=Equus caballus TaxID=9796 RepID=A0A9L0RTZ6_HORSE